MNKISWQTKAALCLMTLSALFYFIDYQLNKNIQQVLFYFFNDIAFAFIQILLVAIIVDNLLKNSERQRKIEKLNMVIGVFFIEVGSKLLSYFSKLDSKIDVLYEELKDAGKWTDKEYAAAGKRLSGNKYELDVGANDLDELKKFMATQRDFLIRLLENPVLMEHETFTELLMAVFHIADEFENRQDFTSLPESDLKHLEGDIIRAYDLAIREWLVYMKYLKNNYPYLFSLAIRTSPFDRSANAIVGG